MQQDKILVLCPTRQRPKQCLEMVNSFLTTAKMSSLKLLIDNDDPCLEEYRRLMGGKVAIIIDCHKSVTSFINDSWHNAPAHIKWFCVTNDDFVYKTDGWDVKLTDAIRQGGGLGIAYGDDTLQRQRLPTTSIISREIIEYLGYLQMPTLTHLFGDNVWKEIGTGADCLFYEPGVIIEHNHALARKAEIDSTCMKTNSRQMYDRDGLAFHQWLVGQAIKDIETVEILVENNRKTSNLSI